jgi:peroxiredoxin
MPLLNHFSQQNPFVQVLGLGLDSEQNIQKFLQKVQVSYPLFRIDIKQLRLLRKLGNDKGGLPFTLVLNEKGNVVWSYAGELHEANLKKILKSLNSQ